MVKSIAKQELPQEWKKRKIKVYRITVDEKLDNNTVRLLACPLVRDVEKYADRRTKQIVITDRQRNWDEEHDFLIKRDSFEHLLSEFGLKAKDAEGFTWETINEGQIYLLGEVMCEAAATPEKGEGGDTQICDRYIVDRGKSNFYRIDGTVKETIKRLYFSTLRGRRKHAGRS